MKKPVTTYTTFCDRCGAKNAHSLQIKITDGPLPVLPSFAPCVADLRAWVVAGQIAPARIAGACGSPEGK
jgi:hypothetical protein